MNKPKKKGAIRFNCLAILVFLLLAGCGKSEAVKSVESQIGEIEEEISLDSAEKIITAEKAYSELSEDEKKAVSSTKKLEAARNKLNSLVEEKKKELYGILKPISIQETTEMTYLLLARDFTRNAPSYKGLAAKDALKVIDAYWDSYKNTMSVFDISVTDQDLVDAFSTMTDNPKDIYKDGDPSKGINKDTLGMVLANEENFSIGIAKSVYEAKDPYNLGFEYEESLGNKASDIIKALSFLEEDEGYDLLKKLHNKDEKIFVDIASIVLGLEGDYEQDLTDCREAAMACEKIFGE